MTMTTWIWKGAELWIYLTSSLMYPFSPPERLMTIDGIHLYIRRSTSDRYVAHEVCRQHTYDVRPRGIVLDLGANIGSFSPWPPKLLMRCMPLNPKVQTMHSF